MEDILKFKAEAYDVMMKIAVLQTDINSLNKTKETLLVKIETLESKKEPTKETRKPAGSAVIQDISDETRMKEQLIIQKRLSKTNNKVRKEPPEDG